MSTTQLIKMKPFLIAAEHSDHTKLISSAIQKLEMHSVFYTDSRYSAENTQQSSQHLFGIGMYVSPLDIKVHLQLSSRCYKIVYFTEQQNQYLPYQHHCSVSFVPISSNVEEIASALYSESDFLGSKIDSERPIAIPSMHGYDIVYVNDILYVEAAGNYSNFILNDDSILVASVTLSKIESLLPPDRFIRVSRKHLVRLTEIKKVFRTGKKGIQLTNDKTIETTKASRSALMRKFVQIRK